MGRQCTRAYEESVYSRQGLPLPLLSAYRRAMPSNDPERERRLAERLRDNLKRRKAQARGAEESPTPSAEPAAPSRSQT